MSSPPSETHGPADPPDAASRAISAPKAAAHDALRELVRLLARSDAARHADSREKNRE